MVYSKEQSRMKTILLATCLLVAVVGYAVDYEEINGIFQDLDECRTSYVKTSPDYGSKPKNLLEINAWYCALVKRGVIDENDVFIKENIFPYCERITVNVDYCKTIVSKCVEKANLLDSESNVQKSLGVVKCYLKSGLVDLNEGTNEGTNKGKNEGTDNGKNEGRNEGTNEGTNGGTNGGTNEGTNGGLNEGPGEGTNNGTNKGTNEGTNGGTNNGTNEGTNEETDKGTNEGTNEGTNKGRNAGTNKGTNEGSNEETDEGTNEGTNIGTND